MGIWPSMSIWEKSVWGGLSGMGSLLWARLDRLDLERGVVVWRARLWLELVDVDGLESSLSCRGRTWLWLLERGDFVWREAVVKLWCCRGERDIAGEVLSMRRRARPAVERRIVGALELGYSVNSTRSSCSQFRKPGRCRKAVV